VAPKIDRRTVVAQLGAVVIGVSGRLPGLGTQPKPAITVYKDPSCGCCAKWVDHMKANGFTATVNETTDMAAVKSRYHVGGNLASCHTSVVGGYVIEGHVPAADVKRLLAEKPKNVVGLAIPGMPQSAPGMDMKPFVAYEVLAFDTAGKTTSFAKHAA
jgi:hypothetical protein